MSFDASERENQAREFLHRSGLDRAQRTPMSGDASTRRYERLLTASGRSLIFMDAPPAAESEPAGPQTTPDERRALATPTVVSGREVWGSMWRRGPRTVACRS